MCDKKLMERTKMSESGMAEKIENDNLYKKEKVYKFLLSETWLKIIKESLKCHLKPPRCYSRETISSMLFSLQNDIEEVK